jgi:hypothetical protein
MMNIVRLLVVGIALLVGLAVSQVQQTALTPQALENITAFTRVLGYVRYFSPSDAVAQTSNADWEQLTLNNIPTLEKIETPRALAQHLQELFAPYAPTLSIAAHSEMPPLQIQSPPKNGKIRFWVHLPVPAYFENPNLDTRAMLPAQRLEIPLGANGEYPKQYFFLANYTRIPVALDVPDPNRPLTILLTPDLTMRMPIAVYEDSGGTLPRSSKPTKTEFVTPTTQDRATRLATVALTWVHFQHLYSYWQAVKTDWAAVLRQTLPQAAQATAETFDAVLLQMLTGLRDGHVFLVNLMRPKALNCQLPISFDVIENRLMVTTSASQAVQVGDEIVRFDNQPVLEVLAREEALVSGSTQWKRAYATLFAMVRGGCTEVKLSLRQAGEVVLKRQPIVNTTAHVREPRPAPLAKLGAETVYLDLTRVEEDKLEAVLVHLQNAKHVVLDVRGYPTNLAREILSYLSNTPLETAPFFVPVITQPDGKNIAFADTREVWTTPKTPQLTKSLAFVVNANLTISFAESVLGMVEGYKLGAMVGSATAGANGDVVQTNILDIFRVYWSGLHVTKFDGSALMDVGIQPTHPAERTVAGVKAGRDELLEAAYTLLTQQSASTIAPVEIPLN